MQDDTQKTFSRIRHEFISDLPSRLIAMGEWVDRLLNGEMNATGEVQTAAHGLASAAKVHHLYGLSEAARKLGRLTTAIPPDGAISEELRHGLRKTLAQIVTAAESSPEAHLPPKPGTLNNHRVLIVTTAPDLRRSMHSLLEDSGCKVEAFDSIEDCQGVCGHSTPSATIILDADDLDMSTTGAKFIDNLQSRHPFLMPVIFLSSRSDMESRLAAHRAGATRYLVKPVPCQVLLNAVAHTASFGPTSPYRVLAVSDDVDSLADTTKVIGSADMEVRGISDPMQILDILEDYEAEAIVLDINTPRFSMPELIAVLRDDARHERIPAICLMSDLGDTPQQRKELEDQGGYYLRKPAEPHNLALKVSTHAQNYRRLKSQIEALRTTLHDRERQVHALNEHTIASITDADGIILQVNDKFCEASGYSRKELIGQNHRLVKSGLHSRTFYAQLWQTIRQGKIWHGELCNRSKDGSLYWVETSIIPFLDARGKPYQYISVRTDITSVKEAEQRLALSQTYANIISWEWNIESDEVRSLDSKGLTNLFGQPDAPIPTTLEGFVQWVHPEDRKPFVDSHWACIDYGDSYQLEYRVKWPNMGIRWLSSSGDVVRDPQGKPIQMLGALHDITHRKQMEAELIESRERLKEAQSLAKLGYWEADLTRDEISWSDEIYRIFGLDPAIFTPKVKTCFRQIHPDDLTSLKQAMEQASTTGTLDLVHRVIRPDGDVRFIHVLAKAEGGTEGELPRLAGTVQDVTELKRAEQAMLEAKEAAESASLAKSEFLASMSHELRTPLNSILGFAQLFKMDSNLPESSREQAHEIERAGQHLLTLVNDVMDLARIEAGKLNIVMAPVDIASVINDSLGMVAPIAQRRDIRLINAVGDARQATVRGDYTRLQQVLMNLLVNAIKYNPPQGAVRLIGHRGEHSVRISIVDTGYGIPIDRQARIFNSFDRLGMERGHVEGSGIGLVITRSLVEAMDGQIGFESREGHGSTFWVEFPTIIPNLGSATMKLGTKEEATAFDTKAGHALYIEDNPINQRLMEMAFSTHGSIELRVAHSAEFGIQLAQSDPPALILMDINLPGMDGYEALSVLKENPRTAAIPVIAVSANAMKGDEMRGIEAGFVNYLIKPIDIPTLFKSVDNILGQKE